jgi:site-specific DNA-methyltransferase (adenine-specific)
MINAMYQGNCKDILKKLSDNTYTGILTDPPYGLSFMGKKWDYDVPDIETFKELLRVTKHGGYMLCFAGSRTQHRMAVNIEDAGWIIKDTIMWVYGSGFPKSHDIGKAIDAKIIMGASNTRNLRAIEQKFGGEEYEIKVPRNGIKNEIETWSRKQYDNQTELGQMFRGYGTALKPAYEPIIVAMKPCDGTYAENAINHGVAGLNINECRIKFQTDGKRKETKRVQRKGEGVWTDENSGMKNEKSVYADADPKGRWPANVIHDGSDNVIELFPDTGKDSGSAARFFYCAKASKTEKNAGIEQAAAKQRDMSRNADQASMNGGDGNPFNRGAKIVRNHHPTVKPIALMEYLAKLIKMPENTKLLDPFMGSGTSLIACQRLGIDCDGIEMDEDYFEIAKSRIRFYSGRELDYELDTSHSKKEPTQLNLLDYLESV